MKTYGTFDIIHNSNEEAFLLGREPLEKAPPLPLLKISKSNSGQLDWKASGVTLSWHGEFPPMTVQATTPNGNEASLQVIDAWRLPIRFREGQKLNADLNKNEDGSWRLCSHESAVEVDVIVPILSENSLLKAQACMVIVNDPPNSVRIWPEGQTCIVADIPSVIPA